MLSGKIAWRNIWRHKGKSLVIGTILFLGALLMTVGNSVINGAKQGLQDNMINRFIGHLVIKPSDQKQDEVFTGGMAALKILPDYIGIKEILNEQPNVSGFVPMTRGSASILNPDGNAGQVFVFGVDFDSYQSTFLHNIIPVEGRLLEGNSKGIIISQETREQIYDRQNFWVVPQGLKKEETALYSNPHTYGQFDVNEPKIIEEAQKADRENKLKTVENLIIMGFGSSSFGNDIRIPVKGILKFEKLNELWNNVAFMDIESYRDAFGYISAANQVVKLSDQQKELMNTDSDSMDDLFGSDEIVTATSTTAVSINLNILKQDRVEPEKSVDTDQGAYNFVTVKLAQKVNLTSAQKQLQQAFDKAGMSVEVITWESAIGTMAQFMSIGQSALSVFVMFIFFVAIIIIMNTLSMAAMERVTEIGMMRAVGAQKWFISKMFVLETFFLSFVFGGAGIIIGAIVSVFLASLGIPVTGNRMLSLMFASDTFNPVISLPTLISGVIQLGVVTILAVLYPLFIARKITPLEAIARD